VEVEAPRRTGKGMRNDKGTKFSPRAPVWRRREVDKPSLLHRDAVTSFVGSNPTAAF
jgi:hypothetical protein